MKSQTHFRITVFVSLLLSFLNLSCEDETADQPNIYAPCDRAFTSVQKMPRWPGCADVQFSNSCTVENIETVFNTVLFYPEEARENEIEGTVFVNCVIDTSGLIGNCIVARSLGFGCDEEALKLIGILPKFEPGRQGNIPVCVRWTFGVNFEL